jgi:hypothetical protein
MNFSLSKCIVAQRSDGRTISCSTCRLHYFQLEGAEKTFQKARKNQQNSSLLKAKLNQLLHGFSSNLISTVKLYFVLSFVHKSQTNCISNELAFFCKAVTFKTVWKLCEMLIDENRKKSMENVTALINGVNLKWMDVWIFFI